MFLRRQLIKSSIAAVVLIVASLVSANAIRSGQEASLQTSVAAVAAQLGTKLEERLRARLELAELLRLAATSQPGHEQEAFAALAATLYPRTDDVQAFNWVSADGIIETVIPLQGNERARGLDLKALPVPSQILQSARETQSLSVTPPLDLAQGGRGFVAYLRVWQAEDLVGFVSVVFRTAPVIAPAIARDVTDVTLVDISDQGRAILETDMPEPVRRYRVEQEIDIANRAWTVVVAPSLPALQAAHSFLDEAVLFLGVLAGFLFGVAVFEADRSRTKLRDREERFELALRGATDGLFDWNAETGKTYYSPRWFEMLGYAPDELEPGLETFLALLNPEDEPRIRRNRSDPAYGEGIAEEEFRMRHKNGSWINILSRAIVLREGGVVKRVVGTHVDITELRRQQQELEVAAQTDELTGMRNRRGLSEGLAQHARALSHAERLAVLHLDLDMFKTVNDTLGHDAGDEALRTTARRLSEEPFHFDLIARVGGDEFLLALRTSETDDTIVNLAEHTIRHISAPFDYKGRPCRLGASIGIAFLEASDAAGVDQVISHADIALGAAKNLGRGHAQLFEERMQQETVYAAELATEIGDALRLGHFKPFFQPQIDVWTGAVVGLEALVRWNHPTRGVLEPGAFLPYAERSYLIGAIDESMVRQVCKIHNLLSAQGYSGMTISVNMSTDQLRTPGLAERLEAILDATGVDPASLRIEILESTLLEEHTSPIMQNVDRLAEMGFQLDLDDFGTGHAAIASMLNLPVSRVKLDRSLISNVHLDRRRQAVVKAIIEMARSLSVDVLAEGVEVDAEQHFLKTVGCHVLQGYLLARPMPVDALETWLARR